MDAKKTILTALLWLTLTGFNLNPSLVPVGDILAGGPGKDGIPALTNPETESGKTANHWLRPGDRIMGVLINGKARAYPVRILNWHEIVNDRIGEDRFVVSYCPLCGSGIVFDSRDRFGVSGLLYQSDVLLYDKRTESLWSQLDSRAITGRRAGERLKTLPVLHTTWDFWFNKHPHTTVLSRRTGYSRDYNHDPYAGYASRSSIYFPIRHRDSRLHPKAWVIGLQLNDKARAWALDDLRQSGEVHELWQGHRLHIQYDKDGHHAEIIDKDGVKLADSVTLYWFAWVAFHPETELWRPKQIRNHSPLRRETAPPPGG